MAKSLTEIFFDKVIQDSRNGLYDFSDLNFRIARFAVEPELVEKEYDFSALNSRIARFAKESDLDAREFSSVLSLGRERAIANIAKRNGYTADWEELAQLLANHCNEKATETMEHKSSGYDFTVNLSNNDLGDSLAAKFFGLFPYHTISIELNLSHNSITSEGARQIASIIKNSDRLSLMSKFKKLEVLDLSFNKIEDVGASALFSSLKFQGSFHYSKLPYLNIENNFITYKSVDDASLDQGSALELFDSSICGIFPDDPSYSLMCWETAKLIKGVLVSQRAEAIKGNGWKKCDLIYQLKSAVFKAENPDYAAKKASEGIVPLKMDEEEIALESSAADIEAKADPEYLASLTSPSVAENAESAAAAAAERYVDSVNPIEVAGHVDVSDLQ